MNLDYEPDSTGDVLIQNGDFVIGDCSEHHVKRILARAKGSTRSAPLVGVGVYRYYNAPGSPRVYGELAREIRLQLEFDGFIPIRVEVNSFDNINIVTERIK
jgi:hypothetical protein